MTEGLLHKPALGCDQFGVVNAVSAAEAGWQYLNFSCRRLSRSQVWKHDNGPHELAIVVLAGRVTVQASNGEWEEIGRRADVFSGMPYALYLPCGTSFELTCQSQSAEIACAWVPSDEVHAPCLVTPADCSIEIRGGNNATRQINSIIAPGFDCHRLVCVEVYTPGGNWSSYPPHKHDAHVVKDGRLLEAKLEELYFYKFRQPEGFAFQRVYTDDLSLDQALVVGNHDLVRIPRGYHPVSAAWGYDCYYLNFLAGSAQSLAASDDPRHAWVKQTWTDKDSRVPMVTHAMEAPLAV